MEVTRQEVIEEYIRRNPTFFRMNDALDFRTYCTTKKGKFHEKQFEFLTDEAKNKVICCSRRSGKTKAIVAKILDTMLRRDGALCLYIAFTALQGYEIAWDMFRCTLHEKGVEFKENNTHKRIILKDNASMVQFGGVDKRRELFKYLGKKYDMVVIDECQVLSHSLFKDFLVSILGPAGWDVGNAPMILAGTPNASCTGPFKDAWDGAGQFRSFKRFHWTVHDNPFLPELAGKATKRILAEWAYDHGIREYDPKYRREAGGEWVRDDLSMVFDFNEARNVYERLPDLPKGLSWQYVIGVDTGYTDADAMVVLAFCPEITPNVYLVDEYVEKKSGWEKLKKELKRFFEMYEPISIVMDSSAGGGKFAEDLVSRSGLPVEAADKISKQAFIGLFNGDLRTGKYQVFQGAKVIEDFMRLEWEWKGQIRKFSDRHHGDLSDANLYAWRKCYHYLHEAKEEKLSNYEKMVKRWKHFRAEEVQAELDQMEQRDQYSQFLYGGSIH